MSTGVTRSLECLAASENDAVVDTLIAAIDHAPESIRGEALQTLLHRKSKSALRGAIARWPTLSAELQQLVVKNSNRLTDALMNALIGSDESVSRSASDIAVAARHYDLIEPIIDWLESCEIPNRQAGTTLLRLVDCLVEDLAKPRDYRDRRDPQQVRRYTVSALEASVGRYAEHGRLESVEAFLALASRENAVFLANIRSDRGELHRAFLDVLANSERPGVVRLLLSTLDNTRPPLSLLRTIGNRADTSFLRSLLERIDRDDSGSCNSNLSKIDSLPWVDETNLRQYLGQWNDALQQAAIKLIMRSGIPAEAKKTAMIVLLQVGHSGARALAMASLADFPCGELNELVVAMVEDLDPQVRACALVQLRPRNIPGAIATLIKSLESEHSEVTNAARSCLQEFTFARFLAAYHEMAPDVRRSMGALVKKVDPRAIGALVAELRSGNQNTVVRAMEVATLLGHDRRVQAALIDCLKNTDQRVRAHAADVLANYPGDATIKALRERLTDECIVVQEVAERSLEKLGGSVVIDEKSTIQWADLLEAGIRAKE